MIDTEQQNRLAPKADEIDFQAAQWIERRYCTEWSAVDQSEFDDWLGTSLSHRVAFLRIDSGWKSTERLAALHSEPHEFRQSSGFRIPLIGKVVAVIVVLAIAATAASLLSPRYQTYATALGGHRVLTLDDGSRIELNTDTTIRVSRQSGRYAVVLERGEAYFDVIHEKSRPFTVVAGNGQITDLGTKFLVRRNFDQLQVSLFEGRARFDQQSRGALARTATLAPGDVIIASANSLSVTHRSDHVLSKELSWRRGVLLFDDTPLAEAVRELNRYNGIKIVIVDPAIGKIGIGGTFATNNVAGFTHVAQNLLHLHVVNLGNEIVIAR